ncbi:phage portal protein [Arthrobacter sp. CJ23]|uniref:phage portal protein n=1 Tax=Arthrobacter sp. CJ23 TaxID=2972479 RepID=UPI00215B8AB3|nr:phage portal protein [Arthrobacter sp. CJ23]UVJ37979.1 phage portal protein [Arthrobacter sp. CJ23]
MGFFDYLFGTDNLPARQEVAASYIEEWPLASPFTDNSGLERLTFESLYGLPSDASNVPITRKTAMSIPAIAKSRSLIATSIARMPLIAEKAQRPLATQPSFLNQLQAGVPNFQTVTWIVDGLIFYGRSFLLIEGRQSNGLPASLRLVPEWNAEVNEHGELIKAFDRPVSRGSYIRIDAHHEGLLNFAGDLIRDTKELERVAAEVGANPVPSILLKQTKGQMTQDEITALLGQWSSARRKRYGSVAFANDSVDAQSMGQAAENLLIEGRNFQVLQLARALSIPAYFLDGSVDGASLTYTNTAGKNRELIEAISPYMVAIEQTLSLYLPAGTVAEFDTSALLRGDTKERMDMYAVALTAGIYTVNEVRAMENLDALPGPEPVTPPAPEPTTEESPNV